MTNMTPNEFVTQLLIASTELHIMHFRTKSYSQHITLKELYDGLTDLTDTVAEQYFGTNKGSVDLPWSDATLKISDQPITYVRDLYKMVQDNRKLLGPATHIQNSIDEIQALITTTLYKLENLK